MPFQNPGEDEVLVAASCGIDAVHNDPLPHISIEDVGFGDRVDCNSTLCSQINYHP